jgi:hypothetical protein
MRDLIAREGVVTSVQGPYAVVRVAARLGKKVSHPRREVVHVKIEY